VSIWNRIGDVASNTAKGVFNFAGDVAEAAGSASRFAWDVGTAPWNNDDEYNGFTKTFKSAWEKEGTDVVKPFASAGGAIYKFPGVAKAGNVLSAAGEFLYKANQEVIREPLTTYFLVQGDVNGGLFNFFDPDAWKKAYKGAQEIDFGKALFSGSVAISRKSYDPKFNIYDPREREAAYKSGMYSVLEKAGNVGIQIFGDLTLGAAKGIQAVRASTLGVGKLKNADLVAQAAEDITKAQYGVNNRFTKVLKDFTDNNSAYALSHPMVRSSTNPGLLAHLLGDSVDVDETALILRSALGDPKALDDLRLQRTYVADALEAERGKLSAVDEFKLFSAPDGSGMLPFLNDNPAVSKEALDNYNSLLASDKYFADLMEVGKGGGTLTRTTGLGLQGIEDFIAKSRSLKFYDQAIGNSKVEVYQPTPFHRLYQKISWAQGQRPAGLVDFNDADSYKEIIANLSRLEKRIDLTPAQSKSLLDNYIQASTPEARFTATLNLEATAMRALAKKHNIDEEIANKIYNNYKGARVSALKSIKDKGFMVDTDGSIIKVPQLESQTANFLPLMDFDLMDNLLKRNGKALNSIGGATRDTVFHYADVLQDAFKAGALLRLGYTQRNAIDSQLRIAASVGSFATLRHLGPGLKNLITDKVGMPARLVDRYRAVDAGMNISQVQQASTKVVNELKELKNKISAVEARASLKPDDLDIAGELNTLKLLEEEKRAVYQHYTDVLNRNKTKDPKKRIGTGSYEVTTSDGQTYILNDAFGGPLGDMFRRIASSGNSFERMVDSNTDMYKRKLSSKGIGQVKPTDPGYFDQWAQTLRQQFANSAVVKQIIAGKSIDDIARWLKSSPEGRDLRSRLAIDADDSVEYVAKVNGFLDQYLPISSNLRDKIGSITPEDLRSTFKDPTTLPIIHGHILEENLFNVSQLKGKEIVNSLFKLLGTMPEDAWARNPLYVHLYREEARRRINVFAGVKGDRLTIADQEAVMSQAHKVALREMKEILFNIERKTNLATAMKYISPFFSAQENAYKTWMKLAAANPSIVNKGYLIWQAPNRSGLVTDQDGNEVPVGQTSGNDIIWVGLPKGVTKIPGLQSLTELGIPKGSLDIIFQGGMDVLYNTGNPNIMSDIFPVGPYVGVPVSELVKKQPSLEESFKWALPFGPSKDAISGFLPTWFKKLQTRLGGQEDPQFARTYQLIWNTEQQNAKRDGRPPVRPEQILNMTKDYWNMRTAASLIMPFAPRFESPYRYYLDKSREYKRIYGLQADAKFLQDYPEFFSFTSSLSQNPAGVQSSIEAVSKIKQYGGLISDLAKIDPKLIGLVVNDPTGYDFSQASYNYLYGKRISPDSPQKFLTSQSPAEAQKKNDAEKGWIQYNKFSDMIDNELQKRGLSSTQQKGAEDLKYIKEQVIFKLGVQTDATGKPMFDKTTGTYVRTAWYDDYLDSDGSKTNKVIAGLGTILNNADFMEKNKNNTTWKSVSAYLDLRKAIAKELLSREAKSIEAKSNVDIKFIYDGMVNKLKQDDKLGFAYLYDRFLSQDLVYDKYLTPKEVE
jgi:5'-deoxynucleotidase YfbR-like HD superfamily hydrolase